MKYQVKLNDNEILYDIRDDALFLENPEVILEINKVDTFNFKIYDDHPLFMKLEKLKSKITVLRDNKIIFSGRIISEEQSFDNSKLIKCEGCLGFLNDSILEPFDFAGNVEEFFTKLIDNHNLQVKPHQQIKKGQCTVIDKNNYIRRSSSDYLKTMELVQSRLLDSLGGYLRIRYEADGVYLDYLEDFLDTSTQIIEFGENLIDLFTSNDASTTYSVVLPLGASETDASGNDTGKRVDISSVNNGSKYLINADALAKYGYIVAPVSETTWDDVTLPNNLLTKARKYLDNQAVMLKSSLELTALDLSAVDVSLESFFIYEYVRIKSSFHGVDKTYLLTAITIPLTNPENTTITLGEQNTTLSGIELGNKHEFDNVSEKVENVKQDFQINTNNTNQAIDEVKNDLLTTNTLIEQTANQIRTEVLQDYVSKGTFDEYKHTTSTEIIQTNEKVETSFNSVTSQITQLDNETKQAFEELSAYIRGYMNKEGQPVLELGSSTSPVILKLLNNRIQFLMNNSEVAYISDGKLFITDGEFLRSLIIGQFAFVPRTNKNLSLKINGGV